MVSKCLSSSCVAHGTRRVDGLLHPRNSCLLPPIVLVLEDGRFLMGSDTICVCRATCLGPPESGKERDGNAGCLRLDELPVSATCCKFEAGSKSSLVHKDWFQDRLVDIVSLSGWQRQVPIRNPTNRRVELAWDWM